VSKLLEVEIDGDLMLDQEDFITLLLHVIIQFEVYLDIKNQDQGKVFVLNIVLDVQGLFLR
jgi:hypothetical protein